MQKDSPTGHQFMTLRDQLVQQVLALPPDDRVYLVELLDQSLTPAGFATPALAAEWETEVHRRIDAYDRGETPADDAETAVQKMRRELVDRRAETGG
jgi:putative addiction module component (TIGR02574 family)